MKWLLRLLFAALLFFIVAVSVAWLAFPRYAQLLIDKAVKGKNISIRIENPGLPQPSGIPFGRLEVMFETPVDSCTNSAVGYTFVAHNGRLSWKRSEPDKPERPAGLIPKILRLDLALHADSVNFTQDTGDLSLRENTPSLTASLSVTRKKGFTMEFLPESLQYSIENGTLSVNKLRFDGITYTFSIDRKGKWVQKAAPLRVATLHSGGGIAPLSDFSALFGLEKDPENPCGLTFKECSVNLFDLKAETPRIDYNPLEQETSFILDLKSMPLDKLPGFKGSEPEKPFATGQLSGSIPVELKNSILSIRNATVRTSGDTQLMYYSQEKAPFLSIKAGKDNRPSDLFSNLDATFALDNDDKKTPGIALESFSAGFFGGTLKSGPVVYDPVNNKSSYLFRLENVNIPEHIHLHGDFKASLQGPVNGTIPFTLKAGTFSIDNAHISSKGKGSILHAPPRKKKSAQEQIFGDPGPDATYAYSEPDLIIFRDTKGKTTVDFTLKQLTRQASGGTLKLSSPKGRLALWHVGNNPSLVSLSGFSAGFMEGSVAIENVDYDMAKRTAQTKLILNNIPLQQLLDMQGMKKIFATGSVKGTIPVIMKDGVFEIPAGTIDADQTGKIIYSTTDEERAAANESIRFTYEALSNFNYSELVSSITMSPDGQSLIRLQLKGVNPSFQEGRPVHLNLNVEQNLLDLLRSLSISTKIEEALTEKALQNQ